MRAAQDVARGLADLVQLPERDHLFVRRDLKNAVGRGVDDRRAGAHVLLAKFLDDLGAGGGLVAERAASDAALEFVHDLRGKTVRDTAETASSRWIPAISQCPVVVSFPGDASAQRPKAPAGDVGRRDALPGFDVAEAEPREIGKSQSANARDIAQRIGACWIAKRRGVGHGADADAIEHDPDDAREHKSECSTSSPPERGENANAASVRWGMCKGLRPTAR